jgi:hypothetical protein
MAYIWEDKVGDVVYSNPEQDTVKILWKNPDTGTYHEHYLAVDEEDEQFQALLEKFGYDVIDERTRAANEIVRQEFKTAFADYAERMGVSLAPGSDIGTDNDPFQHYQQFFRFFNDYDIDDAEHKERLFGLKLYIFEQEYVKDAEISESVKQAKTTVRKALKPIQALAAAELFRNEDAEIHKDDEGNITGVFVPFT